VELAVDDVDGVLASILRSIAFCFFVYKNFQSKQKMQKHVTRKATIVFSRMHSYSRAQNLFGHGQRRATMSTSTTTGTTATKAELPTIAELDDKIFKIFNESTTTKTTSSPLPSDSSDSSSASFFNNMFSSMTQRKSAATAASKQHQHLLAPLYLQRAEVFLKQKQPHFAFADVMNYLKMPRNVVSLFGNNSSSTAGREELAKSNTLIADSLFLMENYVDAMQAYMKLVNSHSLANEHEEKATMLKIQLANKRNQEKNVGTYITTELTVD